MKICLAFFFLGVFPNLAALNEISTEQQAWVVICFDYHILPITASLRLSFHGKHFHKWFLSNISNLRADRKGKGSDWHAE